MKIRLTKKVNQIASALLTALVICSILSLFVMYYLSLIEQQGLLNARSQTWNMAIAVSEAGIEEGLQQVNNAWPDMATDGWTYDGSTCYWKSNTLADGNSYMSYIYITNSINPTVVARAYVTPPTFFPVTGTLLFFATGGGGTVSSAPATLTRCVEVHCIKKTPWTGAMIAKKNIDLNGNGISTDSFDSSNPAESVNGQYNASFYRGAKGDIATNLGVIDSISGGNANVYGHAHTGPGSPANAVQIGPNGYVGGLPQAGNGIQPGYWLPDANFTFPTTSYPDTSGYYTPTSGLAVTSTTLTNTVTTSYATYPNPVPTGLQSNIISVVNGTFDPIVYPAGTYWGVTGPTKYKGNNVWSYSLLTGYYTTSNYTATVYATNQYDHIMWGAADINHTNYYVASSLSGKSIVLGTNVVLAVSSGISMSGNDTFTIVPGGNCYIYAGGTSCAIGGNGFVNNAGYAGDLILYCAPTVTSLTLGGNGTFIGVVVAPNADVSMNGSGSNLTDFVGCLMANSVTMNGHMNFHYDEALGGNKSFGRFLITSWNEIPH